VYIYVVTIVCCSSQRRERRGQDGEHQTAPQVPVGDEPEVIGHPAFGEDHPRGTGHRSEQVYILI